MGLLLIGFAYYDQLVSSSTSARVAGFSLSGFQVSSLDGTNSSGSILLLQFTLNDDTPVGCTLIYADYNLYADGGYVGHGIINRAVIVPARGSVTETSLFLLPLAGSLRGSWRYFVDGGDVDWNAQGNASITQSVLGKIAIHFDCSAVNGTASTISCSYALY